MYEGDWTKRGTLFLKIHTFDNDVKNKTYLPESRCEG
jgi:hypothetical protein